VEERQKQKILRKGLDVNEDNNVSHDTVLSYRSPDKLKDIMTGLIELRKVEALTAALAFFLVCRPADGPGDAVTRGCTSFETVYL